MWLLYWVTILLSTLCLVNSDCPGYVNRKGWDALDAAHVDYLERPVNIVIIQHTVTPPCSTDKKCEEIMQSMQNYYMDDLKYWDVGASFYVGGNGKIYEGNGWLRKGAHTYGYNSKSIGISFIGDYNKNIPTNAQLEAVKNLINCGVEDGHIAQDFHVVGHKQLIATESPGRKLYNAIRKWPEWTEDVSSFKN